MLFLDPDDLFLKTDRYFKSDELLVASFGGNGSERCDLLTLSLSSKQGRRIFKICFASTD